MKKQGNEQVGATETQMVVSDVKPRWFRSKKVLAVIALLVVIIIVGVVIGLTHHKKPAKPSTKTPVYNQAYFNNDIGAQLSALWVQGKKDQANALLQKSLNEATTKQKKGYLYELQAGEFLTEQNYTDALAAAKNAIAQSSTPNALGLAGQAEQGLGDKAAARNYYQQAMDGYTKSGDEMSAQDYRTLLNQLGT